MFRISALLLAASVSVAADPPKSTSAGVTVMTVTLKNAAIQANETVQVPVQETVKVTELVNGQQVTRDVAVTRMVLQTVTREWKLKDVKATGVDGKAIAGDDLEKAVKAAGTVVMTTGKLSDDLRKVFKDGTVFVEQPSAVMPAPPGTGGPAPLPPPKKDQ